MQTGSMQVQKSGFSTAPVYRFQPGDADDGRPEPHRLDRATARREDLPYRVELWDHDRKAVEQVLAVTAHGSIGYAAFYAATREFPERYVTLRHNNSIVSRANGPEH